MQACLILGCTSNGIHAETPLAGSYTICKSVLRKSTVLLKIITYRMWEGEGGDPPGLCTQSPTLCHRVGGLVMQVPLWSSLGGLDHAMQ